jgi:hypothetical protein
LLIRSWAAEVIDWIGKPFNGRPSRKNGFGNSFHVVCFLRVNFARGHLHRFWGFCYNPPPIYRQRANGGDATDASDSLAILDIVGATVGSERRRLAVAAARTDAAT